MFDMKTLLFMSLFLLCGGTLGGWALASKLAGQEAALNFLYFGFSFVFIVFAGQLFLFFKAKNRLIYQVAFSAFLTLPVIWLMMCLVLPMYWVPAITTLVKVGVAAFAIFLFICNGVEGVREFEKKWHEKKLTPRKYYNPSKSSLDWDKVTNSLHLSVSVHIPGVPQKVVPFLSVLILLSMILGLNFRNIYPTISMFAWGIPCIIVSAAFIQTVSIGIAQAFKVVEIEEEVGEKIRSKNN